MPKYFAPASFQASDIDGRVMSVLEQLDDEYLVLFNFQTLGPQRREIDVAVISPWGVDVIEIKDKRGVVVGNANGVWEVTSGGRTEQISNRKGSVQENPYEQAYNSMQDLQRWLEREYERRIFVRPIVLIPSGNPRSHFESHRITKAVNGADNLLRSLCSTNPKRSHWTPLEYVNIPARLGLSELGVTLLSGSVRHGPSDRPIVGAVVEIAGIGTFTSNTQGDFHTTVPTGTLEMTFSAPGLDAEISARETVPQGTYRMPTVYFETPDPDAERDVRDASEVLEQILEADEVQLRAFVAKLQQLGVHVSGGSDTENDVLGLEDMGTTTEADSEAVAVGPDEIEVLAPAPGALALRKAAPASPIQELRYAVVEFAQARRRRQPERAHLFARGYGDFERGLDRLTHAQLAYSLAQLVATNPLSTARETGSIAAQRATEAWGHFARLLPRSEVGGDSAQKGASSAETWRIQAKIHRLTEEYLTAATPDLRRVLEREIGSKLGVSDSPDRAHWYRQVLERLARGNVSQPETRATPDLTELVLKAVVSRMAKQTAKAIQSVTAEDREVMKERMAEVVAAMPEEPRRQMMRGLGLDALTASAILAKVEADQAADLASRGAMAAYSMTMATSVVSSGLAATLTTATLPASLTAVAVGSASFGPGAPFVAAAGILAVLAGTATISSARAQRAVVERVFADILAARMADVVSQREPASLAAP